MECPDCSFDNPEGMKFCGNCGAPLCNICPSCSSSNPVQFKFCGNCGIPLTPPQAPGDLARIQKYIPSYLAEKIRQSKGRIEGERRNVTVVFADISGFTHMSETHDPEEVSAVATICHTMLGKIIYKYEGVVDKIVGDGLMSIFGVPTHEDDPERAILAAIEMQQGMKDLSKELRESMGASLGLSIGINTGIVVIGDIGTNLRLDYTVMGDVVNTASRLQEEAEPGEIFVTQKTYRAAAHCFDFQTLEPIPVRGKSRLVRVYKVIQQKEGPLRARGIEGLESPLIGRTEEFAICKQAADQLMTGKGGALLITGEAGLGKSRLVAELKEYVGGRDITWLEGKCASYSRSINYWVFVDALKNYFNIGSNDDATEIERRIRDKKLVEDVGESIISTIGSLLSPKLEVGGGADDLAESERKLRIFTAVRDVLAAESRSVPLILVLEDLHWADELSMELLLFLMKDLSQHRATFVCTYRPPIAGEQDTYPVQRLEEEYSMLGTPSQYPTSNIQHPVSSIQHPVSSIQHPVSRIVLNPLSSGDSNMLLKSLLAVEELPSEMKRLILDKAGGNPLYLEEVVRSIIDDGAIEQRDYKWLAVKEIEDIEVPSTVQGVIMARIDRLKEEPKHVLQCASVIGRSFEYDLLLHLAIGNREADEGEDVGELWRHGDAERSGKGRKKMENVPEPSPDLDKHLEKLEKMGFISREEGGETAFRFRHVLIQDVTYGTVLRTRRKELHEMLGRYIEGIHSHRLDEFYEILAYHYSNSDNTEASLYYLVKAGNKNRKSSAESALRYFHKALDILDNSSLTHDDYMLYRQSVYGGLGDAYSDLGKNEIALSSFETVLHAAEQAKDDRMKAEALRKIAGNKDRIGDWEAALNAYEESLAIVRNLGDPTQIGLVYNNIGYGYFERGELDEAMKYFQEALNIGEQYGDLRLISDASNGLGALASIRHDFDEAIRNYQVSLKSYRELGESHFEAQTYLNLGVTHFKKNEAEIADRYYEDSLRISEKCGYSRLIVYTYFNRAELHLWRLDLDRATDFCKRAFQTLHTLDDKWARAEGYKLYGMIYRRQRNFQSAKEAFHTSLEVSRECDYLPNMAEVYCEMGLTYKEEGTLPEALEHFGRSREIFEELDITEEVQKIEKYIAEIRPALERSEGSTHEEYTKHKTQDEIEKLLVLNPESLQSTD
jgi:class 3 adenylate cyclase/tetratricopeptide (TPR) repeat protein